jgi:excisionase family DNA binding protein
MDANTELWPSKLLRAHEVAKILDVSPAFAYRLMQKGDIKTVCIGSVRRVRVKDLTKFIEENIAFQN